MTIDERLEALARNLELTAQMQQKTERELHELGKFCAQRAGRTVVQAGEINLQWETIQRLDKAIERLEAMATRFDEWIRGQGSGKDGDR
jgi:hypothetical protein